MSVRADLVCLTIEHAQSLERKSRADLHHVVHANAVLNAARRLVIPLARALASAACRYIDRHTARMADQAVWFNGVKTSMEDGAKLPVSNDTEEMIAQLESAQSAVMQLREAIMKLSVQFFGYNPESRVARSLKRQLVVLADLFDAIESARWAVMEREADLDIDQGKVKYFESVDDLLSELNS
ncbi:hypothetical protein [Variovorax sp. MHTC-1]|uniref:hypothetical protein n=1 Tax=Variovorax sp. MHTC-1 TaxID=2495593 RepID=UPI000F88121F|nr:hypothetical protein [Variovorax sp. MHTC-1]RST47328.1 hypothetical protein EJI01_28035 [Variovorax sp. MHTC-1]